MIFKKLRKLFIITLAFCFIVVSCKNNDSSLLNSMFSLEERAKKGAPPQTIEDLQKEIDKYEKKIDEMTAAVEKEGMYWRLIALKYMEKGLYTESYNAAKKAIEFYPNAAGLYYIVGVSAGFKSKEAAVSLDDNLAEKNKWLLVSKNAYEQAIQIEPTYIKARYGLAVLYSYELEMYEEAVAQAKFILGQEPKNIEAMFVLGRSLYGTGRLSEAVDVYTKIIETSKVEKNQRLASETRKQIMDELYDN